MQAGKASARDWRLPLEVPERENEAPELQSKPEVPQIRRLERA
jgi:hypothetical protein